jgi:hypothetical protein
MRAISLCHGLAVLGFLSVAVASCGSSSDSNGAGATGADCKSLCAKADALKCSMTTPGECATQCDNVPPACRSQADAFTACGATATFSCSADGEATANGCDKQGADYLSCVFANLDFDGGFGSGD